MTKKIKKLKTKETITKEVIVKWFKMVCEGIRSEYEQGASYRKLDVDVATLKKLLNS